VLRLINFYYRLFFACVYPIKRSDGIQSLTLINAFRHYFYRTCYVRSQILVNALTARPQNE
jgi:hypothetical protein